MLIYVTLPQKESLFQWAHLTANSDGAGNYWATYYNSSLNYTADANTTVYKGTLNGTSSVTLTEVGDREIPSGNAVVLKSSSSTIILANVAATSVVTLTDNDLKGGSDVAGDHEAYTLSNAGGVMGFYKFTGALLDPNKAHLELPTGAHARMITFGDNSATAIDSPAVIINDEEGEIYDLMGRKIKGQPKKGIYLKSGKKFIVK